MGVGAGAPEMPYTRTIRLSSCSAFFSALSTIPGCSVPKKDNEGASVFFEIVSTTLMGSSGLVKPIPFALPAIPASRRLRRKASSERHK